VLFLSFVDKAQTILLSSGLNEQPESVQFGGSLVKVEIDLMSLPCVLLIKTRIYII